MVAPLLPLCTLFGPGNGSPMATNLVVVVVVVVVVALEVLDVIRFSVYTKTFFATVAIKLRLHGDNILDFCTLSDF